MEEFEDDDEDFLRAMEDKLTGLETTQEDIIEQTEIVRSIGRMRYSNAVEKLTDLLVTLVTST